MQIDYRESRKLLSGKKFPIYLLNGTEEFLLKELAGEIVNFLTGGGEAGDAVLRFDCESDGVTDILNGVSQPQMFSPVSVVVVENAKKMELESRETAASGETAKKKKKPEEKFKNPHEWERFQKCIASPLEDMHLILMTGAEASFKKTGAKFVDRAFNEIESAGCVVNFPRMYDEHVARWLAERAARRGLKMPGATAEYMVVRAGRDLRHLANELDKLELYRGGGGEIDEAAIDALSTSGEEELVFKLVDAVIDGRAVDAERLLSEAKKSDVHPLPVIAGLAANIRMVWQARRLLEKGFFKQMPDDYPKASSSVRREMMRVPDETSREIAEDPAKALTRKTPFYVHKCVRQAKKLPPKVLERWVYYCSKADRAVKGVERGVGPGDLVFDRLIAEMMREVKSKAVPTRRGLRS